MRYCNFEALTDEEIVLDAKDNDNEEALVFLINKYRNFVRAKARSYFLIGAEREDIIQEGMIGLYKAIRDFRNDKLSSFRAFAELCVTRQIITAIKTAMTVAALAGRQEVTREDLRTAIRYVLPHRMRRRPFEEGVLDWNKVDAVFNETQEG